VPDIVATRPADGAPVDVAWGQEVHDIAEGIQGGFVTCVWSAANLSAELVITFPRPFVARPNFAFTSHSPHYTFAVPVGSGKVSATILTVQGRRADGTNATGSFSVEWIAFGKIAP
jgi:hypothetical protein